MCMIACAPGWGSGLARYDNRYSRIVRYLKIILPLVALGLLSTLFLFARSSGNGGDIPFAEISEIASDQMITAPTFSGVVNDGATLQLTALSAQPQSGDMGALVIFAPQLDLRVPDGPSLNITAGEGTINTAQSTAQLGGLARLETSNGYIMETTDLVADLETGTVTSLGPLAIRAPFGELSAGLVRIEIGKDGAGQQMHFTNGVSMLYNPAEDEGN